MTAVNDTVHGRIAQASSDLTPAQVAVGLTLLTALGVGLLFAQEPALHDSMHNFRHAAGITCH